MKTREKIIMIMYNLISEKGYDKSSIGQICDQLGIKKPSVYYYFKSKEDILVEIFEQLIKSTASIEIDQNVSKDEYKEFLRNMGLNIIKKYQEDPILLKVIMEFYVQSQRIERIEKLIKEQDELYKQQLKDLLNLGIEKCVFPMDFDVEKNMEIIVNTLQGIEFGIVFELGNDYEMVWNENVKRIFS